MYWYTLQIRCHYRKIYGTGMEPSPLLLRPFIGLFYKPFMMGGDDRRTISEMNEWQDQPKYPKNTCPSVVLSPVNPTK
jgi:hypothetical protein